MAFYCIIPPGDGHKLLQEAANAQGLEFCALHPDDFDFVHRPTLGRGDMLYRAIATSESPNSRLIEELLLNEQVATFYRSYETALAHIDSPACHVTHYKNDVPVPRRVWPLTRQRQRLREYVDYVGGLPVVLKVIGHSRGIGVMKVTTLESLFSLVDYLVLSGAQAILQEYIDVGKPAHSERAIVLGDKVVSAYSLVQSDPEEFRSNIGSERKGRTPLQLTPEEEAIMVRAVHLLGVELGAVDFVRRQHQENDIVIFEVNFPFNFTGPVKWLNDTIHCKMVNYLWTKATMPQPAHLTLSV
ncbi:MAG: hypothetical protein WD972_00615 [Candidatus Andersenbacteria bacterium]